MSSRRTITTAKGRDRTVIFQQLLAIKRRRERALRRQLMQQTSAFRQLEQDICACSKGRALLREKRTAWLAWSGTKRSHALLLQKQRLMTLRDDDQQWVARQHDLVDARRTLMSQQETVRCALRSIMKKREKLRSLLNDAGRVSRMYLNQ